MKKNVHPDYTETQVTCTCGNTFTTRSTVGQRLHPLGRLLAVPPVLHRQAEDPRHRRSRRPVREALRPEVGGREEVAPSGRRSQRSSRVAGPALCACPDHSLVRARRDEEAIMFEAVEGLVAEHADLEQRLADPSIHADQGLAKRLNQRYAELSAIVRTYDDWLPPGRRHRGRPRARAGGPVLRRGGRAARRAAGRRRGAAAAPAGAPRRGRLQGRAARDQVRRGRRGVGAVRRRPAADVHPLRRAARLEDRAASTPTSPTSAATSPSPSRSRPRAPRSRGRRRTRC